jgi:hypothetical protein
MKKTTLAIAGLTVFSSSLAAFAGPDWQVIEKARAAQRAEAHQPKAGDSAAMMQMCQSMMPSCQAMMKQSCQDMMQQQPK